jgi:hypothetical protein
MKEQDDAPQYPLNAIAMLQADHQKVKDLFRQYEAAWQLRRKRQIAEEICREFELHTRVEEEVFYPALEEVTDREGEKLVAEALQDHDVIKGLIAKLRELDPEDVELPDAFQEPRHQVEHHVREEEDRIFPQAWRNSWTS